MFDIQPEDILKLDDVSLRELIARLCEAELTSQGLSPVAVTWGGSQTAADGGLDVRVAHAGTFRTPGFIPRPNTGFQVKKPDMPRKKIEEEMRPAGELRPVIRELAQENGAYVIVSSTGSTSDRPLRDRVAAMRAAAADDKNAASLYLDFYDRTRIATWVRSYAGLIAWLRNKAGRNLRGWQPFGAWGGDPAGEQAEYIVDEKLKLHLGAQRQGDDARSLVDAIDELRAQLAVPKAVVRLVGLSGVGKTRLAESLFDARLGTRALPRALAVYTNMSDDPDPQPPGMASDLIAQGLAAILVVDNCTPELHRRLAEICSAQNSTVSVLTIEYDVREDQPEGTQVVTLETSSEEVIEQLLRRRFPHISSVNSRTIAAFSGGNARIAIALAQTLSRTESFGSLTSEELFERLFRQRQDASGALLDAALACSLVYSFNGEEVGEADELRRLAALIGQNRAELHRHVSELTRRELVQRRGPWHALLPHAIANRLASRALEDVERSAIWQQLLSSDRLAKSFSRRLSYLHDRPNAVKFVSEWFAPAGILHDIASLDPTRTAMFVNVAPVAPELTLAALERVPEGAAPQVWHRFRGLLRSLAYDPALFERSTALLTRAALVNPPALAKECADVFASLFTILLSGTHATLDQRLQVAQRLLASDVPAEVTLGLAAFDHLLEATHFSSVHSFDFGARSRDFGARPKTSTEVTSWFGASLASLERLYDGRPALRQEAGKLVARNFRGLWTHSKAQDHIERISLRIASHGFWREGWIAARQTLHFDRKEMGEQRADRLARLTERLAPAGVADQIRAVVLSRASAGLDLEDIFVDDDPATEMRRLDAVARTLAQRAFEDLDLLRQLMPELLTSGGRTYSFGQGLAAAATDRVQTWGLIVSALDQVESSARNLGLLLGFLSETWTKDAEAAQRFLDDAEEHPTLRASLPILHCASYIDERGIARLMGSLAAGKAPIGAFRHLAAGRVTDKVPGHALRGLLLALASQEQGFTVAVEILHMRLYSDNLDHRPHAAELLRAGRELLLEAEFERDQDESDYQLGAIAKASFLEQGSGDDAAKVAQRLREAVAKHRTQPGEHSEFLTALLAAQPVAVLDALFLGDEDDVNAGVRLFDRYGEHRPSAADVVPQSVLMDWCNKQPVVRYPIAARIVTFASRSNSNAELAWSSDALAIIKNAPDGAKVLQILVDRFRPNGWSGSLATILETHLSLLDALKTEVGSGLLPAIDAVEEHLQLMVQREREWETQHDHFRNERFEPD